MIFMSLKSGFAQMWANKRMVLVFYLANLFFSLMIMLPFRAVLNEFVGHSLMGAKLGGALDMDFLFEFFKHNRAALTSIAGLFFIVPAAYWLFVLFISGGAFAVFASGEKYTPPLFWGHAARYFGRFFRLFLWSLPVFAILFCLQFLVTGIERLVFGSDPYQYITYWGGWIKVGLRVISLLLFGLVFDYARIHTVTTDERRMRISLWEGIKFAFRNILQTFGLAFFLFIAGAIALVIYYPIADVLSAPNTIIIILLFVLQQLYIFFRTMLRLTLYSSQMHLYHSLSSDWQPETLIATEEEAGLEGAPA